MSQLTGKMRAKAKELLERGEVSLVLGWEKGRFWYASTPVFISKAEDSEKLIWDDFCHANLAKYLINLKNHDGKIALFVKGCDSRAVVRLVQDNQIPREKLVLIGIPCPGLFDTDKARGNKEGIEVPKAEKCLTCTQPNPIIFDELLAEKVAIKSEDRFAKVLDLEKMSPDEKYDFWTKMYDKCIRCYACRNICPACSCKECCFDQSNVGWLGKANNSSENQFFAMTRAMHVAGRCIECGECERACPMGIPIMLINRKLVKDCDEFFGVSEAGVDINEKPPLGRFELNDPEKFM